jgi:hypothetical protein
MVSRSSSARVTSDQHQSGHGSTTGRVRRRAGSVSVYRFGDMSTGALRRSARSWNAGASDAAVIDVHDACTGRVGKLGRVVVPCLPRREVGVYEYAQRAGRNRFIGAPSTGDGDERFGPEQTEVQSIIGRAGPRHGRVESAVEDAPDLNVLRSSARR